MSLETVNGCVVIPHMLDWSVHPTIKRAWATSVATGIDGSEDRAAERQAPTRELSYTVQTQSPEETQLLGERVKTAMLSGRAVVPLFGRAQECTDTQVYGTLITYYNRWDWAVGDYVFISLQDHDGINSYRLIDAGGAGYGEWEVESDYENGSTQTTEEVISTITGMDCPPAAVLQSCRSLDTSTEPAQGLSFTVRNLPLKPCLVRLWFAFIDGSPATPSGTIGIYCNNMPGAVVDPWALCSSEKYRLGYVDAIGSADSNGVLRIDIYPRTASWIQVNAISIYSTCWQMLPITSIEYADVLGHHMLSGLHFDTRIITLPGFSAVDQIWPVIYGRLKCDNIGAVTNWQANLPLTISEPLGEPVLGMTEACPVEVCGITPPTLPDELPAPGYGEYDETHNYIGVQVYASDPTNRVNTLCPLVWGDYIVDKSVFLPLFRAALTAYLAKHWAGHSFGPATWIHVSGDCIMASCFYGFDGLPTSTPWYVDLAQAGTGYVAPSYTVGVPDSYYTLAALMLT